MGTNREALAEMDTDRVASLRWTQSNLVEMGRNKVASLRWTQTE